MRNLKEENVSSKSIDQFINQDRVRDAVRMFTPFD